MSDTWALEINRLLLKIVWSKRGNRVLRYGIPLLLTFFSFLGHILFPDFISEVLVLLFLVFVINLSAWYGGARPGLFATCLTILSYYLHLNQMSPNHGATTLQVVMEFLILLFLGFAVSFVGEENRKSKQLRNDFIGIVSHELKNPLAAIKGFASLLAKKTGSTKELIHYTHKIDYLTNKINDIISDLLDLTKIESGTFTYYDDYFSINDMMREVVIEQRIIAQGHTIKLVGKTHRWFFGDKYRISQILSNLITNAIKYSPGKKMIHTTIKNEKQGTVISIRDFGIGIPQELQSRIFHKFYRIQSGQNTAIQSLGMGLYISKQIAERHGGRISVQSDVNKGATFYLWLPLTKIQQGKRRN